MANAHYVDNNKLLRELTLYRQSVQTAKKEGTKKPKLSNYIGECIMLTAQKMSNRPNFINYPFKEEMVSDGIENCLMYIDNFDPEKSSNPFGYISRIIWYAFLRRITKEKKVLYTKHKLIESSMIYNDNVEQSEWNQQTNQNFIENEHMNDFVKTFEETIIKKKKQKTKAANTANIEDFIEEDIRILEMEIVDHDTDSSYN